MKKYTIIKKCRLCYSANLKSSFNLGKSPLCDQYVKKKYKQIFFPLKLLLCSDCGFSQISCVVDKNYIYKNYIYETKSSITLDRHFTKYADIVSKKTNLQKKDLVLDIGSNDGVLLSKFKKKCKILGVEPANIIAKFANKNGIPTINSFFEKKIVKKIISTHQKPKIITMNNLFANVDNLNDFSNNLCDLIHENGTIIIETSYLGHIFKNNIFDWIYHEHLSYFSINPLKFFFEKKGFKLYDLDISDSKGGSIRYYFTNIKNNFPITKLVKDLSNYEEKNRMNSMSSFNKFKNKIYMQKKKVQSLLDKFKRNTIVGYGASATTTTLLSYFCIYKYFKYLIDDNPQKIGLYSPGYHIPVFSSQIFKDDPPEVIVILAWRYKDIILKNLKILKKKYKIKKLSVIVPLPSIKLYNL